MRAKDFSKIEQYMCTCLQDRAHDRTHVYRVLYTALTLAKQESGVDFDVLIAACMLHDIARGEQAADATVCHAAAGAQKARTFLTQNGFSPTFAERVAACIRTHRFRSSDPPRSIEAKLLFDADKLDAAGAVGIARTLLYQGRHDALLYTLKADGTSLTAAATRHRRFFRNISLNWKKFMTAFTRNRAGRLHKAGSRRLFRFMGRFLQKCRRRNNQVPSSWPNTCSRINKRRADFCAALLQVFGFLTSDVCPCISFVYDLTTRRINVFIKFLHLINCNTPLSHCEDFSHFVQVVLCRFRRLFSCWLFGRALSVYAS